MFYLFNKSENYNTKRPGIYAIVNKSTGDFYIGSASCVRMRWGKHKWALRRNKRQNAYLQNAWNKYGEKAFYFVFLEELPKDDAILKRVEQEYLDEYKPEYNISDATRPSLSEEGRTSMIEKMSKRWIVTSPSGEVFHIKNLEEFCRKHKINRANMSNVAHGLYSHCNGWKCAIDDGVDRSFKPRPHFSDGNPKTYIVTYPDGKREKVVGLQKWAKSKGFGHNSFFQIANGKQEGFYKQEYKGFKVEIVEQVFDKELSEKLFKDYRNPLKIDVKSHLFQIEYPHGQTKIVPNLKHFCLFHNLNYFGFLRAINEGRLYKDWSGQNLTKKHELCPK